MTDPARTPSPRSRKPQRRATEQGQRSDAGFTLMEVLAALVILSVAIVGLISATSNATRTAAVVETRTLASTVASNRIAALRAAQPRAETFTDEGETVQMGRTFAWRVELEPTELDGFREITATVSIDEGGSERVLLERTSYYTLPVARGGAEPADTFP